MSNAAFISALENGHVDCCITMIKALEECSVVAKSTNLKALMLNTSAYFDTLENVLTATGEIISRLLADQKSTLGQDINFHRLLSAAMRAVGRTDWFDMNHPSKELTSNLAY